MRQSELEGNQEGRTEDDVELNTCLKESELFAACYNKGSFHSVKWKVDAGTIHQIWQHPQRIFLIPITDVNNDDRNSRDSSESSNYNNVDDDEVLSRACCCCCGCGCRRPERSARESCFCRIANSSCFIPDFAWVSLIVLKIYG